MPLPNAFDANEIFVLICIIVFYSVFFMLPKRIPWSITIILMLFGILLARFADHLMAGPSINFYDIMDWDKYELFDVLLYLLYAPFAYFFLYLYERLHIRGFFIPIFIVLFSIFAIVFEWINVLFGVFHYKNWELRYSVSVYLLAQVTLLLFYQILKHKYNKELTNFRE